MKTKVIGLKRYYYEDADAPEDADLLPASMHAMAKKAIAGGAEKPKAAKPDKAPKAPEVSETASDDADDGSEDTGESTSTRRRGRRSAA